MEKHETAQLVFWLQGVDGRVLNELTVNVWHELVGHVAYESALGAARDHYRDESRKLMPADVLKRVEVDRDLGALTSGTAELLAEQKATWCREHDVTVEEFDAHQDDHEWIRAVERG
jgi:hypothetical protein